jgi:hypothetical protein
VHAPLTRVLPSASGFLPHIGCLDGPGRRTSLIGMLMNAPSAAVVCWRRSNCCQRKRDPLGRGARSSGRENLNYEAEASSVHPSLFAICAWDGSLSLYRRLHHHSGAETSFHPVKHTPDRCPPPRATL